MSRVVVPIKTEPRCKLCSHSEREFIDKLLLRRSEREKDEKGHAINLEYVLDVFREIGVVNPTEDNIKGHLKNHTRFELERVVEEQEKARGEVAKRKGPVSIDDFLDRIIQLGESDLEVRLEQTGKSGVTVDHALKAAQIKSQRRQDEATKQLLGGLGAAIGAAVVGKALENAKPQPELADVEIEEAEVVES